MSARSTVRLDVFIGPNLNSWILVASKCCPPRWPSFTYLSVNPRQPRPPSCPPWILRRETDVVCLVPPMLSRTSGLGVSSNLVVCGGLQKKINIGSSDARSFDGKSSTNPVEPLHPPGVYSMPSSLPLRSSGDVWIDPARAAIR